MKLAGRHVVIIGGTSGIGHDVAAACLAEGASVTVGSSRQATVDAALSQLTGARGSAVDVTSEESVAQFFASAGSLDHLVFTAGDWRGPRGVRLGEVDIERMGSLFGVRFWGALRAAKHAHRLIAPGGSITFTNGMVAHKPSRGSYVSTAMAGAIEHLTRALAVELAPIRVNAVCPGIIRTQVWNSIPADEREDRLKQMTARLPLARPGETADTTEAYLYLMKGGYTTGQVLMVDGGSSVQ